MAGIATDFKFKLLNDLFKLILFYSEYIFCIQIYNSNSGFFDS